MLGMGGGMPSPEEMAKLAEKMPGGVRPDCRRPCRSLPPNFPGSEFPAVCRRLGGTEIADAGRFPPDFGKKK